MFLQWLEKTLVVSTRSTSQLFLNKMTSALLLLALPHEISEESIQLRGTRSILWSSIEPSLCNGERSILISYHFPSTMQILLYCDHFTDEICQKPRRPKCLKTMLNSDASIISYSHWNLESLALGALEDQWILLVLLEIIGTCWLLLEVLDIPAWAASILPIRSLNKLVVEKGRKTSLKA